MTKLLPVLILSFFALSAFAQWGTGPTGCGQYTDEEMIECAIFANTENGCWQFTVGGCQNLTPYTWDGYCQGCTAACMECSQCGLNSGPACCEWADMNMNANFANCVHQCQGEYPINEYCPDHTWLT